MKTKTLINKAFLWLTGLAALIWFILRTGTNPRRLAYPCQQAAFPLAAAFVIGILSVFSGLMIVQRVQNLTKIIFGIILLSVLNISSKSITKSVQTPGDLPEWQVENPVSKVFIMDTVYATAGSLAAGDNSVPLSSFDDPTMDSLFTICETNGLYLYKTSEHPNGIVGNNDVVVIKPNFQWTYRLGTNTDRIKGLITLILNHPDGFEGEILICDNTQELSDITDEMCNSDDTQQSIIDVVNAFQSKAYPVYLYKWNTIRENHTYEYSDGNYNDGYIIQSDRVTYPKFRSPSGNHYISLRYGIWDSIANQYNHDLLTIINFPVLKAHCMAGATIGIKNWVGVLTTAFTDSLYGGWDAMHYDFFWNDYALIARVMAVTMPKLTIVDASYTATKTNWEQPPNNTIIKTNKMVVSCDPVAASWYAAKYILTPIADEPEYANPDNLDDFDPTHTYGLIIRRWTNFLIDSAEMSVTLDSSEISVIKSAYVDTNSVNPPTAIVKPQTGRNEFFLYPNPGNGRFSFNLPEKNSTAMVSISSINGSLAYESSVVLNQGKGIIDAQLNSGLYIVTIRVDNRYYTSTMLRTK